MSESQTKIVQWARDTFGPPVADAVFKKFLDEVRELHDVHKTWGQLVKVPGIPTKTLMEHQTKFVSECADVLVMLYQVTDFAGGDLIAAVEEKMAANRARKWDVWGDGTGQHK